MKFNRLVFFFGCFPSKRPRTYIGLFFAMLGSFIGLTIPLNLPVVQYLGGPGSLPSICYPLLCCFISAMMIFFPSLTKKDRAELEKLITEQAAAIEQATKEQMNKGQAANMIAGAYQTNLKMASRIKENYGRYAKSRGPAFAHTYRLGIFYMITRTNGVWDLKQSLGETILYSFRDTQKTGEYIGNHHFGYMGRAVGLSRTVLQIAAGMYQVYSRTSDWRYWSSWFDDPADSQAIADGCADYDNGRRFSAAK